jgi:hypothetical protein
VVVEDLPVLVLPTDELLQNISDEVGHDVVALVGGSFLREFATTIDYRDHTLGLARYVSRDHIPVDEYVGVGFTLLAAADGSWQIGDVYGGTDAQLDGLVTGTVVEELGGTSITGQTRATVDVLLDGYALGDDVPVTIVADGNELVTKLIAVEDLLPGYAP